MALPPGAPRDALLDAGATKDKADNTPEELAGYETRLAGMDTRLAILTRTASTNLAFTLAILWRVSSH